MLVADHLTKAYIIHHFLPGESHVAVPHLLWWTYLRNTRSAFGFLFGLPVLTLVAGAIVALGIFAVAFRTLIARRMVVRLAFGAIVGGALGNIVDRLTHGYVVDFIDLRWWPDFNVADSCITLGSGVVILSSMLSQRGGARRRRTFAR